MQKTIGLIVVAAALIIAAAFGLRAPDDSNLTVTDAVATPGPDGLVRIVATINNEGPADRLIAVTSPEGNVELYAPDAPNGPPVPANVSVQMALDGTHLVLDSASKVSAGQLIPLTLSFQNGSEATTKARVVSGQEPSVEGYLGLPGVGEICRVEDGEPAPDMSLSVKDGTALVTVADFIFVPVPEDGVHVPGQGHGHIYAGGMKLARLFTPQYELPGLPQGPHIIRITLNTNDHRAYVVDDVPVTRVETIFVD